jgi:hypothetical protein
VRGYIDLVDVDGRIIRPEDRGQETIGHRTAYTFQLATYHIPIGGREWPFRQANVEAEFSSKRIQPG